MAAWSQSGADRVRKFAGGVGEDPPNVDLPRLSVRHFPQRSRDLVLRFPGIRGLRMRRDRERRLLLKTLAGRPVTHGRPRYGPTGPRRTPTGNAPVSVHKNSVKNELTGLLLPRKVPLL